MVHLKLHLLVQLSSFEDISKGVLKGLYKDAQEGAFEVKIKGKLEVTIEFHLKMCIVVHLLWHRISQNY